MEYYICFVDENELTWHLEELPSCTEHSVSLPHPLSYLHGTIFSLPYFVKPMKLDMTCRQWGSL